MGAKKKKVQQQSPRQARGAASFFKVMHGSFKRRLRLPPSFTRHVLVETPCRLTLRSSIPGRSWHVEMEGVGYKLFFHDGWETFLKDHMIEKGDFLQFRYDGNLGFNVHAYGSDGSMKQFNASDDNEGKLPTQGAAQMTVHPGESSKIPSQTRN